MEKPSLKAVKLRKSVTINTKKENRPEAVLEQIDLRNV